MDANEPVLSNYASSGLLVLRIVLATIMFFHGTTKLLGWWGGEGLDRASALFASQGFRPPRLMAIVASSTEIIGSTLIGCGLLTVLGVAMLTGVLTNVAALHIHNGLDHRKHGSELELALLAGVVAIGLSGPGRWSLDHLFSTPTRTWLGLVAVAAGVASGFVIVATRDRGLEGQASRITPMAAAREEGTHG